MKREKCCLRFSVKICLDVFQVEQVEALLGEDIKTSSHFTTKTLKRLADTSVALLVDWELMQAYHVYQVEVNANHLKRSLTKCIFLCAVKISWLMLVIHDFP